LFAPHICMVLFFTHIQFVAEQLHCLLHVKELKVAKTELKRQIGD